jgi:hypothetical protein
MINKTRDMAVARGAQPGQVHVIAADLGDEEQRTDAAAVLPGMDRAAAAGGSEAGDGTREVVPDWPWNPVSGSGHICCLSPGAAVGWG